MSEAATQAVVDATDTQVKPAVEVNDARKDGDDLDVLLKQYETETAPKEPPKPVPEQTPGAADDLRATLEQVKGYVSQANALKYRQDMDKTISEIRGDLDPEFVDSDLVESWLDAQARKDPRLSTAWLNRDASPKQFERVKVELGKSLAKKFSKMPDRQATEDREAVTAAVRGASTRIPEGKAPDYAKMSDADLQKEKDKLFGN